MLSSPLQKYQQSSVKTASPGQLVVMLYDGAIRFVKQGIEAIEHGHIEQANTSLIKAQNVVNELMVTLNFDYPIAAELVRIYEYMIHLLITSNTKKDREPAAEALSYLIDLRESWASIAKPKTSSTTTGMEVRG
ncbi:flagellar export chaperone FliS [Paenibacillus rhizovicinus]|uniref:Flagellar secretion chaperone FliS n=1 Tax=Paenibacillus rhizovicinus TaxID=2704463 RepID=A0A6C0P2L5_9BACL|nr:flagellar export chaperone FliS [Paenibacillus rhizovicinus]QHW32601.1 flagellar export chaperone FliS [Paenibacillus rhizovicinus]